MFLHVIVLVAGDDVEDRAPVLLFDHGHPEPHRPDRLHDLLVGVGARHVEIEVSQRPERLHVDLVSPASQPSPALVRPDRNSPVAAFQASTAFALPPPAEVPTLRMSSTAALSS